MQFGTTEQAYNYALTVVVNDNGTLTLTLNQKEITVPNNGDIQIVVIEKWHADGEYGHHDIDIKGANNELG